jgi:hypothetical protein
MVSLWLFLTVISNGVLFTYWESAMLPGKSPSHGHEVDYHHTIACSMSPFYLNKCSNPLDKGRVMILTDHTKLLWPFLQANTLLPNQYQIICISAPQKCHILNLRRQYGIKLLCKIRVTVQEANHFYHWIITVPGMTITLQLKIIFLSSLNYSVTSLEIWQNRVIHFLLKR